jgi:hypothetical protein
MHMPQLLEGLKEAYPMPEIVFLGVRHATLGKRVNRRQTHARTVTCQNHATCL